MTTDPACRRRARIAGTCTAASHVVMLAPLGLARGAAAAALRTGAASGAGAAVPAVRLEAIVARRGGAHPYRVDVHFPQLVAPLPPGGSGIDAGIRSAVAREVRSFEQRVVRLPHLAPPAVQAVSELEGVATTDLVSKDAAAFTLDVSTYVSGAAHGEDDVVTFDFDTATGRSYRLADLFTPKSAWLRRLSALSRLLLRRLPGFAPLTEPQWLDSGITPVASNFSAWALTPFGLEITFQDYQVAAYAAGTPSILVPYGDLGALFSTGGPASALEASPPPPMALLPATTPPVLGECWHALVFADSGGVEPLRCAGGRLNVAAFDELAWDAADSGVIALAGAPTQAEVHRAMCANYSRYASRVFVLQSEQVAAAYHGWRLARPPALGFPGYCRRGRRATSLDKAPAGERPALAS